MQYENNISSYKKKSEINVKNEIAILLSIFLIAFLISRVTIFINAKNVIGIAPFGISFIISMSVRKKYKYLLSSFLGTCLGYISIINTISGKYQILVPIVVIVMYSLIVFKLNVGISERVIFLLMFFSYVMYGALVDDLLIGVNITLSLINLFVVVPIYYVVKYGINCISDFNSNYFFTIEDFLSVGIIASLVVSGIGDVQIFSCSIRTIMAYFFVVLIACIGGTTYGSAIGVCMGIIVGVSSGDLMMSIIFYSIIGLISGMFRQTGKVFVVISFVIVFLIISIYFENIYIYSLIEAVVSGLMVFCVPKKIYSMLECELDLYKKRDKINQVEIDQIKDEFLSRVNMLNQSIQVVSESLKDIGDDSNISFKNKSAALIENLSQRVCVRCSRSKTCWERDFNLTYNSFEKLIRSCESNKIVFPHQLEKVCFEKLDLIKEANSLVTTLKSQQLYRSRLEEGRFITARYLNDISTSIQNMSKDFGNNLKLDANLERILRKALNKRGVYPRKVFCFEDENGRTKIKLDFKNCEGSNFCYKVVAPLVSDVINIKMEPISQGCDIDYKTNECSITLIEAPRFSALSYAAVCTKSMEKYSGDTYSFEKCGNGKYINVISDGMGFGPKASKDSMTTVKILEKYMESGFSEEVAINMINSVTNIKFDEDESFSTLDFNSIDLYSGVANFIKIGAAASFLKRGRKVKTISSNMPPFGTMDKLDLDVIKLSVRNGDLIVMISDGVVDIKKDKMLDYSWLEVFLEECSKDPKQLSQDILDKAMELSGKSISDDMTVLVCKVI